MYTFALCVNLSVEGRVGWSWGDTPGGSHLLRTIQASAVSTCHDPPKLLLLLLLAWSLLLS